MLGLARRRNVEEEVGLTRAEMLSLLGLDTTLPPPGWRPAKGPYLPGTRSAGIILQGDPARFRDSDLVALIERLDGLQMPAIEVRHYFYMRRWPCWGGVLLSRLPQATAPEDLWLLRLPLGETSIHAGAEEAIDALACEVTRLAAIRPGRTVTLRDIGDAIVVDDGTRSLARVRLRPGEVRLLPPDATVEQVVSNGVRHFLLTSAVGEERFTDCGQPDAFEPVPPFHIRVSTSGWSGTDDIRTHVVDIAAVMGKGEEITYPGRTV